MNKYSINTRMKNQGPAKYLIDTQGCDDLNEAFSVASNLADSCGADHFVEIVENYSNEKVATFNEVVGNA
jgi:hypothetical protein